MSTPQRARLLRECLALSAEPLASEPEALAAALVASLRRGLEVDAARVRLVPSGGAAPIEVSAVSDAEALAARALHRAVTPVGPDGAFGRIEVGSARAGFPSEEERTFLAIAANLASAALQRARSASAERRLATQDAVTRVLAESDSLAEAVPRILQTACEHLGWEVGALWIVDRAGGVLRFFEGWHRVDVRTPRFDAVSRSMAFPVGVGLPGRVWRDRVAAWIPDVTTDPNFPRAPMARADGLHGAFAFPVLLRGEVLGVIEFLTRDVREPDAELLALVTAIGGQIGQFIERKRAEEASHEMELRFARFMQQLPGLAWIKDVDGRYVFANDTALKVFGVSRDALYGRTDTELFGPATAAQFQENDRKALESGTGVQVIETLEHEDGLEHDSIVSKFPILDAQGRPVLVGGIAIDITDRLRAEEALRRSRERLELAQRAGRIGAFEWIVGTGEARWSDIEEQLHGFPPGGFGGKYENWRGVVHPADLPAIDTAIQRAVAERTELAIEFRVVWPDGSVRWLIGKGEMLGGDDGTPLRMVGVNMDVTERKEAEIALQEADRRKDEFVAMLAHELRNPLAPIRNGLALLRASGRGADAAEVLPMLERQVHQMVRLVDDLLELSRVTRGLIELRKERVALEDVVRAAVETSRPLLDARGHALEVSLPAEPVHLVADPLRLAQVLANLMNNAAKYTDPGGRVALAVERRGDAVEIRVADTGVGIPPELLRRVFDLFLQADRKAMRTEGGLGIGLTLVKNLVQLHGGQVAARSAGVGKGSEFCVVLPLDAEADALAPSAASAAGASASENDIRRRVLVVDDNVDAAESLALLLETRGHEVRSAHDGPAALELARRFAPHVVLLDIGMPVMDGYEVARRLRADADAPARRIVAITGFGQEDDRRRAREAGFDHHLVKPVDLDALARILAQPIE